MTDVPLTRRELDLMAVLWDLGSATVPQIRSRLADDLAYTTVQTVLRTLEGKGVVAHEVGGRFYHYRPLIEREQAARTYLRRLLNTVFAGSVEMLVSELIAEGTLTDVHGSSPAPRQ